MAEPIPGDGINTLEGDDNMAFPEVTEAGNLQVASTAMANEFGASAARRTQRADQTAADASAMWAIAMTTPTQNTALALRTATESGAGRTRLEANRPPETGAAAP
jgi:hypothetical protein